MLGRSTQVMTASNYLAVRLSDADSLLKFFNIACQDSPQGMLVRLRYLDHIRCNELK